MRGAIKIKLNSANACYSSVQNILSSSLQSKNIKIKTYRTIILSVVLNGCHTWFVTLREDLRLRVFENMMLRKLSRRKKKVRGDWRKFRNDDSHDLYSSPNIILVLNQGGWGGRGSVTRMGRRKMPSRFWWGNLKERAQLENIGVDGRRILKCVLKKWGRGRALDWFG